VELLGLAVGLIVWGILAILVGARPEVSDLIFTGGSGPPSGRALRLYRFFAVALGTACCTLGGIMLVVVLRF